MANAIVRKAGMKGRWGGSARANSNGLQVETGVAACGRGRPHPRKKASGGEDAHFAVVSEDLSTAVLGVADGVGGYAERGVDSGDYARVLCLAAADCVASETTLSLREVLRDAHETAQLPGAATACFARLHGDYVEGVVIGDAGARVIRNNEVLLSTSAQYHAFDQPYQLAHAPPSGKPDTPDDTSTFELDGLDENDVVIVASDGLFDNVFDSEIASVIESAQFGSNDGDVDNATTTVAGRLLQLADERASNTVADTPRARELVKEREKQPKGGPMRGGGAGLLRGLANFGGSNSSNNDSENGGGGGGKQDDITIVVGLVSDKNRCEESLRRSREGCISHVEQTREMMRPAMAKMERRKQLRAKVEGAFTEAVEGTPAKTEDALEEQPLFSREEVEQMDKARLRSELEALGLPTSGRVERLRLRLAAVKQDPEGASSKGQQSRKESSK